ncbi:MAG: hypothetical protein ABIJ97_02595 [Bacteroidota bacterium]
MVYRFFLFAVVLAVIVSCKNQSEVEDGTSNDTLKTDTILSMNIAEFDSLAGSNVGKTIRFDVFISHVCRHNGLKMYVMDDKEEYSVKVEVSDQIAVFDTLWETKKVTIEGQVSELVIDLKYLENWEKEIETPENNEEATHAGGVHNQEDDSGHHGDPKDLIVSYRKQIEAKNGEALKFYSVLASKIDFK